MRELLPEQAGFFSSGTTGLARCVCPIFPSYAC
jgi:hypothetical protein